MPSLAPTPGWGDGHYRDGQGEVGASGTKDRRAIMAVSASCASRSEAEAGSPPTDPIPNAWRSSPYLLLLSFYVELYSLQ